MLRPRNEDAFLELPQYGIFAVADGMGGHAAGEVASRIAVDTIAAGAASLPLGNGGRPLHRALVDLVRSANRAIREYAERHPECAGMGTTLTVLALLADRCEYRIAHVGDSRAYRIRGARFRQLTTDHTLVQRMVEDGLITPQQARKHPLSNVLTRSLGVYEAVDVDIIGGTTQPGDLFLLCSDGLTGMIEDMDLEAMLGRGLPLDSLADQLIEAANLRGGHDNITAVLARLGDAC